mmetsp:Transcript_15101/g.30679  ORF Transcript_15101/g.30679 Transcript_15101/m.30679 type:complete len:219 (+) Transcript_15101:827-1483(+)
MGVGLIVIPRGRHVGTIPPPLLHPSPSVSDKEVSIGLPPFSLSYPIRFGDDQPCPKEPKVKRPTLSDRQSLLIEILEYSTNCEYFIVAHGIAGIVPAGERDEGSTASSGRETGRPNTAGTHERAVAIAPTRHRQGCLRCQIEEFWLLEQAKFQRDARADCTHHSRPGDWPSFLAESVEPLHKGLLCDWPNGEGLNILRHVELERLFETAVNSRDAWGR